MTMPLHSVLSLRICVAGIALIGLTATSRAGLRMGKIEGYAAAVEDWAFNAILPFLAYLTLLGSGLLLGRSQD
ncbi:MAG: hypothetical protein M3081_05435, partial [Gemmatimonadota bacterium]|nr:hypothetical protein [Gemmatimonadota bacterium]